MYRMLKTYSLGISLKAQKSLLSAILNTLYSRRHASVLEAIEKSFAFCEESQFLIEYSEVGLFVYRDPVYGRKRKPNGRPLDKKVRGFENTKAIFNSYSKNPIRWSHSIENNIVFKLSFSVLKRSLLSDQPFVKQRTGCEVWRRSQIFMSLS